MVNETVPKDILDKLTAGITITGVDLDIRDLNVAQDEVKAVIRADTLVNQTADLKITLNGEDVNVTATDLDIRDLTSASDSVEVVQDTAADLKAEVHNPAGTALSVANYVYDGSTWRSMVGNSSGAQKTFFEWLADNGTFIGDSNIVINDTETLYTVPANKVAYIISAHMQVRSESTVTAAPGWFRINNKRIMRMGATLDTDFTDTAVMNFSIPIKITVGQTVQIESFSANVAVVGGFTGYEVTA